MNQFIIVRNGGFYVQYVPQDPQKSGYLTIMNWEPACISHSAAISSICRAPSRYFTPDTRIIFPDNPNPPLTPEEKQGFTDLVERRKADNTRIGVLEYNMSAISDIAKKSR